MNVVLFLFSGPSHGHIVIIFLTHSNLIVVVVFLTFCVIYYNLLMIYLVFLGQVPCGRVLKRLLT